ncbi:MAG: CHASE domain-containing protein [Candidatus Kapabacteria bacterium]|nr:CHASE domain-containing protein [Candidatus Kapabacteria bacterium]
MDSNLMNENLNLDSVLKQTAKKRSVLFDFKKSYPAYIVLVVMLALSYLAYYFTKDKIISDNRAAFDKAITSIMNRLDMNYRSVIQVHQSMRGLYDNLVQVVRDYFLLYGSVPTKTYPSITALMSVQKVDNSFLDQFIHYVQSQGYYDYQIKPSGYREYYYPVEFIVPENDTFKLRGFDFSTNDILKGKVELARKEGRTISTPAFRMFNDSLYMFIISPVYKKNYSIETENDRYQNFESAVVMLINTHNFFKSAIGKGSPSDTSIIFNITQLDNNGKEEEIFHSSNYDLLKTNFKPALADRRDFQFADRNLMINFSSVPYFGGSLETIIPNFVLVGSLAITFVIFLFILSMISSKTRAIEIAEKMTRSQRRILMASKDIIGVLNYDGIWKSLNPAFEEIFGISPNEVYGKSIYELAEDKEELTKIFRDAVNYKNEFSLKSLTKMKSANGSSIWISWIFTFSNKDKLIYAIGRDVTKDKIAEELRLIKSKQIRLAEQLTKEANEQKTYFMTKLSHKFRNILTSLIGNIQLINTKSFADENELETFSNEALKSSEELFTIVSDMDDYILESGSNIFEKAKLVNFEEVIQNLKKSFDSEYTQNYIHITSDDESKRAKCFVVPELLTNALFFASKSITAGEEKKIVEIFAKENQLENSTEIQLISNANGIVDEFIGLYKSNSFNAIELIEKDNNDIFLNLALASSFIRVMNGTVAVDSLGKNDIKIFSITLPYVTS